MKKRMCNVYKCDECGKKYVDEAGDEILPAGWVEVGYPHDLNLTVNEEGIKVSLKGKHFCSNPCLAVHIVNQVNDALGKSVEEALLKEGEAAALEALDA